MMINKQNFINLKSHHEILAINAHERSIESLSFSTLKVKIDRMTIIVKDVCYMLMIINNILSTDLLNQQDFKYKLSEMSNDLSAFEITDTEEQIFHALSA